MVYPQVNIATILPLSCVSQSTDHWPPPSVTWVAWLQRRRYQVLRSYSTLLNKSLGGGGAKHDAFKQLHPRDSLVLINLMTIRLDKLLNHPFTGESESVPHNCIPTTLLHVWHIQYILNKHQMDWLNGNSKSICSFFFFFWGPILCQAHAKAGWSRNTSSFILKIIGHILLTRHPSTH
jgi:hypothetical protein